MRASIIVSISRLALLWHATQNGIRDLSDILMLFLIALAVLVPAAYASFCQGILP
jgi:hypothetical protein